MFVKGPMAFTIVDLLQFRMLSTCFMQVFMQITRKPIKRCQIEAFLSHIRNRRARNSNICYDLSAKLCRNIAF